MNKCILSNEMLKAEVIVPRVLQRNPLQLHAKCHTVTKPYMPDSRSWWQVSCGGKKKSGFTSGVLFEQSVSQVALGRLISTKSLCTDLCLHSVSHHMLVLLLLFTIDVPQNSLTKVEITI